MNYQKTEDRWPLQVQLVSQAVANDRWGELEWQIHDLLPANEPRDGFDDVLLELHRDQRTAYRFNLSSQRPTLFVLCHEDTQQGMRANRITASQDEAAGYMDGDHLVLEAQMPPPVLLWIEKFMAKHGELVEEGKKKKRRGKGRSSGN